MSTIITNTTETMNGTAPATDLVARFAQEKAETPKLIKLTVDITLKESGHTSGAPIEARFMEHPDRWFSWAFAGTPLPVKNTVLICREHFEGGVKHSALDESWVGTIYLLCSVHPIGAHIPDYDGCRVKWGEELLDVLRELYQGGVGPGLLYLARTQIVAIDADPGIPKAITPRGSIDHNAKGNIMIGLNTHTDVRTCYLSGQHFYPSVPLAFFYEGQIDKPVASQVATEVGFHVTWYDWHHICTTLQYLESITELHNRKRRGFPNEDCNAYYARSLSWSGWPGDIEDFFRHHSDLETIAQEKGWRKH